MWPLFGFVIVAVVSRTFLAFFGEGTGRFLFGPAPLLLLAVVAGWPALLLSSVVLGPCFLYLALLRLFLAEPVIAGRFRLLFGRSIVPVY